jgi:hypothetical protein
LETIEQSPGFLVVAEQARDVTPLASVQLAIDVSSEQLLLVGG